MMEKYKRAMEEVTPRRSDEALLYAVLLKADKREEHKMKEKKILKKAIATPIAAAVAITLSITGGAAIYSGITYLSQKEIAQTQEVAENISTGVFGDQTEHIAMTVEEYVSDGLAAYATVKYEALDDVGKNWLSTKTFSHEELRIIPCIKEHGSAFGGTSHSYGNFEIEEMRTENERYFYVEMVCSSTDYDGGMAFQYTLDGTGVRETPFERSNIEVKRYRLSADAAASEYFTPTYLEISPLGYSIAGLQNGMYEIIDGPNVWGQRALLSVEENDALLKSLRPTLVYADDTREEVLIGFAFGQCEPSENNLYSDLYVCSDAYSSWNEETGEWGHYSIDIEEIRGVEICGVYFEATEIR